MSTNNNFSCQESCGGKCCTFGWLQGFVFLTKSDKAELEAFLGQPVLSFAALGEFLQTRFTDKKSHQWFLRNTDNACLFFKDGKCSVYEARPTQCRTFPYWPEKIVNGQWTAAVKESCPGVGQGDDRDMMMLYRQMTADMELRKNEITPPDQGNK